MPWWANDIEQVIRDMASSPNGLSKADAAIRLQRDKANVFRDEETSHILPLLWRQISSPIVLILIAAAILSLVMHDVIDVMIILTIVMASSMLGFWQEYRAASAVASLQKIVAVLTDVLRDDVTMPIPLSEIVSGGCDHSVCRDEHSSRLPSPGST